MKFHFKYHRVKMGFQLEQYNISSSERGTKREHCRKSKVFKYLSKPFFAKCEIYHGHNYFQQQQENDGLFISLFCSLGTNYKSHFAMKKKCSTFHMVYLTKAKRGHLF